MGLKKVSDGEIRIAGELVLLRRTVTESEGRGLSRKGYYLTRWSRPDGLNYGRYFADSKVEKFGCGRRS